MNPSVHIPPHMTVPGLPSVPQQQTHQPSKQQPRNASGSQQTTGYSTQPKQGHHGGVNFSDLMKVIYGQYDVRVMILTSHDRYNLKPDTPLICFSLVVVVVVRFVLLGS